MRPVEKNPQVSGPVAMTSLSRKLPFGILHISSLHHYETHYMLFVSYTWWMDESINNYIFVYNTTMNSTPGGGRLVPL